ncbi:MAG: 50S ribosomal protein L10, partial [Candidatus Diapherotrites archaeon]|nr:50S ribosomal protein L10 [Candidatus Diapherotrites archaeon]
MARETKVKEVKELTEFLQKYPVVAIASIKSLPAPQFQEIRKKLRGKAVVRVTKINLLKRAMKAAGKNELETNLTGPIAVLFTEMSGFKLFKTLKQSRSKAPAKVGQEAPFDLIVPKGDTGLPPGPALGDLKSAGINARIDGGSIKVMSDSTVAKKGETITELAAAALNKLGIKP